MDIGFSEDDLKKVVSSSEFVRSGRMVRFVTYLWEHSRVSERRKLKEIEVGQAVFDRPPDYDPKIDSIVRVEATRLRKKLAAYYAGEGAADPVQVRLPPGRYELEFVRQSEARDPAVAVETSPAEPEIALLSEDKVEPAIIVRARQGWIVAAALAAVLALGLLAIYAIPRGTAYLTATPLTTLKGREQTPAISPDGQQVAFSWDGEPDRVDRLYLTSPGSGQPTRLTTAPLVERAVEACPAWSSDNRELGYMRRIPDGRPEQRVRRISDGSEETITELAPQTADCPGLSFSPDGKWLVTAEVEAASQLHHLVLIERGTRTKRYFRPVSGLPAARIHPTFSPDGKQVAFVEWTEGSSADIYVTAFPDGPERRLTSDHRPIRGLAWTPDGGALVVASYRQKGGCSLWRMPLNGREPVQLTEPGNRAWTPSIARTGALVFARHVESTNIHLGAPGRLWMVSTGLNSTPRFSPDGKRLAFRSNRSGASEIWLADVPEGNPRQLTHFNGPVTGSPRWSRDGQWIAFDSRRFGKADVFVIPANGGEPRRITEADSNEVVPCFSPDGRYVYYASDREGTWSVWRKPIAGGPEELVRRRAFAPVFSPDGQFLYFAHAITQDGLFRAPAGAPEKEEPVLPTLRAGMWGNWALAANSLYFVNPLPGNAELQRMDASGRVERVTTIEQPVWWDGGLDVTADGKTIAFASVDRSDSDLYWVASLR